MNALGCAMDGVALRKLGTLDSARLPGPKPRMEQDGDGWRVRL